MLGKPFAMEAKTDRPTEESHSDDAYTLKNHEIERSPGWIEEVQEPEVTKCTKKIPICVLALPILWSGSSRQEPLG